MCYYIISLLLRCGSSIIFFRRLRTNCKLSRLPVKIIWWSFHSLVENDVKIIYTKNQSNRKVITWATFINAFKFLANLPIERHTPMHYQWRESAACMTMAIRKMIPVTSCATLPLIRHAPTPAHTNFPGTQGKWGCWYQVEIITLTKYVFWACGSIYSFHLISFKLRIYIRSL